MAGEPLTGREVIRRTASAMADDAWFKAEREGKTFRECNAAWSAALDRAQENLFLAGFTTFDVREEPTLAPSEAPRAGGGAQ